MWAYLLALSSLTGSVVDERSRPLEGATILVTRFGAPSATAMSDASGRFQLEIEGSGPVSVEAHRPGYLLWSGPNLDPGKPLSIVLARAEGVIIGIVRDGESLDPIPGALVETRLSVFPIPSKPRFGLIDDVSDERGEFRLEGVGTGTFSVSASAPGYGRATKENARAGEPVELYLFPGTGVYGRIVDEKGDPVAGASVLTWSYDPRAGGGTETSDAEGRFALLGLEAGRYRLLFHHDDFAPLSHEVELTRERDVEMELELSRGARLLGRLVNEDEEGIAGKVFIRSLEGGVVLEPVRSRLTVETDEEGFFSLGPVPPGEHLLRAEAREYGRRDVEVSVGGRGSEEDLGGIVLETGLTIRGRVVDGKGAGIENAVVTAFKSTQGMLSTAEDWVEATSDGEGRFVFAGLSEGIYDLSARAPGYGGSPRIPAEPGETPVSIRLGAAGSIRGRVVDPEGRPVPSFVASARAPDGRAGGFHRGRHESGVLVIENVAEGDYALEIRAPGFVPEGFSRIEVSAGEATDVGTVRLRRGGAIEGTVIDTSSEAVPGAAITVLGQGSRLFSRVDYSATSDRLGKFRIEGLPDGAVQLLATHPGYAQTHLDRIEIDSRAGTKEIEVVMSSGGALEGYVRTRDGSDVAGRTIQVISNPQAFRGYGEAATRTSPDGSFRFDHLPSGRAEVQLLWTDRATTYTIQRREIEIVEGETEYVEFLSRRVVVSGRVSRGGAPLPGVEIDLWPVNAGVSMMTMGLAAGLPQPSGPRYLAGVSAEDGTYELLVDEPGEYRLNASVHGVGLPSRNVAIADADSVLLDLDFGGATISGRVIDRETEAPVPGAYVSARSKEPDRSTSLSAQVGADGAFELEAEPGTYALMAQANGYGREEKTLAVPEGGLSDLVLPLSRGLRISGRVIDAGGRGAPGLRVVAVEDSSDVAAVSMKMSMNVSVSDGSFVLEGLSAGRYNILAGSELAGFAAAFGVASGTEELELVLRPAGKIDARVVDGEGNPVPGAIVGLVAIDGRRIRGIQAQADANGRIPLTVPRGNLTVKAMLEEGPQGLAAVAIAGGPATPVEIVLARGSGR